MTDTLKKRKGPRSKTGARAIAAAEKKRVIVELRSEPGTTLAEVAEQVGVSKAYATKVSTRPFAKGRSWAKSPTRAPSFPRWTRT